VVGTWSAQTPIPLSLSGDRVGTVDSASYRFDEDKTCTFSTRATLTGPFTGGQNPVKSESYSGFWTLDGRKLTIERPGSFIPPTVIMLDTDGQSFVTDLIIPDRALSLKVQYRRQK
jgi:hypothetical protein